MRNGFLNLLILPVVLVGVVPPDRALGQPTTSTTNAAPAPTKQTGDLCPQPALSRLTRHRVAAGETVITIAQQYSLIPATLMGLNPNLREGNVPVGTEVLVPPYNGIRVEVPSGSSWRDIAAAYGVRADALYEINGCQDNPRVVFIPGINWSPNQPTTGLPSQSSAVFTGYPLPATASVLTAYGWQASTATTELVFHSGVDLAAERGTPVLAVGGGTVAFVGEQGAYGNLIVINHAEGLQTRYAQLDGMMVEVGQRVNAGDRIGTVGSTGVANAPHLHFEVRSNSNLGWVAQDPVDYVRNLRF
ncbi:MAG: M23 family metallopeptidase [Leptolyngbyaceae cyanobacterium SL_7_1]|nr:M23 family metallopeptidase [Leptolyngbyaceae cyanobacterium SL_7_1]